MSTPNKLYILRYFIFRVRKKIKEAYINVKDTINLVKGSFYLFDRKEVLKKHLLLK